MRDPIGHGVCTTDHLPKQGPDMPLRETLSNAWDPIQGFRFPLLREEAGPLTAHDERLAVVLEVAGVEAFVSMWHGLPGRPLKDRHALARAFVAKAVFGLPTTTALIERLSIEGTLRLCGWERAAHVPGESTFSRLRRVRAKRVADPRARGVDQGDAQGSARRAPIARRDGDRGARETGANRAVRESAQAQAHMEPVAKPQRRA